MNKFFANDFSFLNPTILANEAVLRLMPNMVLANLCNRDFNGEEFAAFGDVVNARVPGTFQMKRKGAPGDSIILQDAGGSRRPVRMDQWPQVSFIIYDGEERRPMQDLISEYLFPAVDALSLGIDKIITSQAYQFLGNAAGHLGGLTSSKFDEYVLETREVMNANNVSLDNRAMLLTVSSETAGLANVDIRTADKRADGGASLRTANLGQTHGFDFWMTQSQPQVTENSSYITATTTTAAASAGATVIAVTSASGMSAGQWLTVAGDDTPQQITAINTLDVTIRPGLRRSVASSAAVKTYKKGAVNNATGYAGTATINDSSTTRPGHIKAIATDGWNGVVPQVGQGVSFGTQTTVYGIIAVTETDTDEYDIELDRPLVTAIADNDAVNLLPAGKYNLALRPRALTLVNRPLAAPRAGAGALSKTVIDRKNRISIRVTIAYDKDVQGHVVTLDTLLGLTPLEPEQAALMLG